MSVIEEKIATFKRAYFTNELVKGLIRFLGLMLMISLVAILLETLGRFTSSVRFWIFWTIIGSAVLLLARYLVWPLGRWLGWWKPLTYRRIALKIAHTFPGSDDPLLSALEFGRSTETALQKAALDQAIARLRPIRFRKAVDWQATYRLWPVVAVPVAIFLFLLMLPATRDWLESGERIVSYKKSFIPPAPFAFVLENDSLQVPRGGSFQVKLKLKGDELPASVNLVAGGQQYRMVQEDASSYRLRLPNLREDMRLRFQAGPYQSRSYQLSVFDRPGFDGLRMEVIPPSYTGLRPNVFPFKSELQVPEGSRVRWKINAHAASQPFMVTGDREIAFDKGTLDSNAYRPFKYRLGIENTHQRLWIGPPSRIGVLKDQKPEGMARLEVDSAVEGNLLMQRLEYQDDYGISKIERVVRGRDSARVRSLSLSENGTWTAMDPLDKVIEGLEGEVEIYFTIYDNDRINGPKMTRTKGLVVEQLSEAQKEARREQAFQNAQQQAKSLREKRENMDSFAEELRKSLMMDNRVGWKEQEKLKELLQKLNETQKATKELKKEVKKAMKKPKESDSADAYEERLRELTKEEKEMEKLKEEIQKLSEELNKDKLEQKLQDLQKENKQRLRKESRMEEALEDLKRQRDILKTAKELQELAKEQKELSEKSEKEEGSKQEEQMKKAKKALDKMRELKKESAGLSDAMDKKGSEEKAKEAEESLKKGKQQLQQGKPQDANSSQKKAGEKMKELSEDMQSALSQMQKKGLQINMESLRRILANLEVFSEGVEESGKEIRKLEGGDPRYRTLLIEQERLAQGAKIIEDSLTMLAERAPQVKEKVFEELDKMRGNIKQAQSALQETERNKAANEHRYSMMAANELALLLDESMQQMMSMMAMQKPGKQNCQKSGGNKPKPGMGKKLDQMGKKIQKLQQGQKKGGQKGQRGMGGKELVKILSEQEQLRKTLREMAKKSEGKGNSGNLEKAAEEMEDIERDLAKGQESNYRERLERIKTRLLESEKAELKRKQKEQRQAEEAQDLRQEKVPSWMKTDPEEEEGRESIRTLPLEMTRFYKNRGQLVK